MSYCDECGETGKDYAFKNRFSVSQIASANFFGHNFHKDKMFIEDWVVEKALEKERRLGVVEELENKVVTLRSLCGIADAEKAFNTFSACQSLLIVEEKRLGELRK